MKEFSLRLTFKFQMLTQEGRRRKESQLSPKILMINLDSRI
jgi:hypothetical protein